MDYPPSFSSLKQQLNIDEGAVVVLSAERFKAMIRVFLELIRVDEDWYRGTYPDVAQAIADGVSKSAKEHYLLHGYFEDRLPHDVEVDAQRYLASYPDVAAAAAGGGPGAKEHYLEHGYKEGRRLPASPGQ
jgi:hypothetical protein